MQEAFKVLASYVAIACEAGTVIILAIAATEALVLLARSATHLGDLQLKKLIWVRFASWIIIALEFALAADIVDTAITPTWNDIGQLAAIAAIRTGLNFFLSRDIESIARGDFGPPPRQVGSSA
jgi:uncharacterized membrane protein